MARICGDGLKVSREQLRKVRTPHATETWKPIPHDFVVQQFEQTIAGNNLEIVNEEYLLARDGQRMFGVLDLRSKSDKDYGLAIGMRNSHDMSFPVAGLLGGRVFVCSNLSFAGEVKVQTKHTKFVMDRLPKLICSAATQLIESRGAQDKRFAAYKATEIESKKEAAYLMLQTIRNDVIPTRLIDSLVERWEKPTHDEFAESWSAWRMFNAVTEILKDSSPLKLAERTQRLHGLLDAHCGLLNTKVLAV
jgi:hypothetical protein